MNLTFKPRSSKGHTINCELLIHKYLYSIQNFDIKLLVESGNVNLRNKRRKQRERDFREFQYPQKIYWQKVQNVNLASEASSEIMV